MAGHYALPQQMYINISWRHIKLVCPEYIFAKYRRLWWLQCSLKYWTLLCEKKKQKPHKRTNIQSQNGRRNVTTLYLWKVYDCCHIEKKTQEIHKTTDPCIIKRFMDNSPTNQLADRQTRQQTNSPTIKLAKKTNSPKLKLSPKSM